MFWNDIKAIRQWMAQISEKVTVLEEKNEIFCGMTQDAYDRILDNLGRLLVEVEGIQSVYLAEKTLDKFEDYMKNVEKLHTLVNEFKGCVSIARSAITDRRALDKQNQDTQRITQISEDIYKGMVSFIEMGKSVKQEAHFKIDAIYKAICEHKEKKTRKVAKSKRVSQDVSLELA